MKQKITNAILLSFILIVCACGTQSLRINNYAYLYNRKDLVLQPTYKIFNKNKDTTALYFKINTSYLLYARPDKSGDFTAKFKVELKAYQSLNDKIPIRYDSAVYFDKDNDQLAKDLIGKFTLNLLSGKNYYLAVRLTDLNRNVADVKILPVYKQANNIYQQAFLPYLNDEEAPYLNNFLSDTSKVKIKYKLEEVNKIGVYYYQNDFDIARPPFDSYFENQFSFKAKRYFEIEKENNYFTLNTTDSTGFYYLVSDTNKFNGAVLHKYPRGFPSVVNISQLLGPLRYITTQEEFQKLSNSKQAKKDFEEFWIQRCGSKERAREVIKAYYGRVEAANDFFTSYKEGWKTDRGMIYLIFGPPNGVFLREGSENWVYGQESNVMSLSFTFSKLDNPFSENDYTLQRSPAFRPLWYTAVDAWRTGRLFSM